eukprot:scaffold10028_cov236-Isochrysis_galbana.AAC.5
MEAGSRVFGRQRQLTRQLSDPSSRRVAARRERECSGAEVTRGNKEYAWQPRLLSIGTTAVAGAVPAFLTALDAPAATSTRRLLPSHMVGWDSGTSYTLEEVTMSGLGITGTIGGALRDQIEKLGIGVDVPTKPVLGAPGLGAIAAGSASE